MKSNMSKRLVSLVLLCTMLGTQVVYATEVIQKDESVFVILDAEGKCKSKTVSQWLHSDTPNVTINDKSDLENIINIKGDEKPTINGNSLTWKSDKNDIYYQGKTSKELPLDVSINYTLDGQAISAKDLAGKSGKLKMTLDIKNNTKHVINIDGKSKDVYTPFMTASIIQLPTNKFLNVKVSTGQLLSDSTTQLVAFVAFPGLKETLNLEAGILPIDLSSKLVIESDVKDFEMGSIMLTATPELPEKLKELKSTTNIEEIKEKLTELKDATDKLADGTGKLSDGAVMLDQKLGTLKSAFGDMNQGISKLSNGATDIYNGSSKLQAGSNEMQLGTGKLKSELGVLNSKIPGVMQNVGTLTEGTAKLKFGSSELYKNMDLLTMGIGKTVVGAQELNAGATNLVKGLDYVFGTLINETKGSEEALGLVAKDMNAIGINIKTLNETPEGQAFLASLNSTEEGKKILEILNLLGKDKAVLDKLTKVEGEPSNSQKLEASYASLRDGAVKLQDGSKSLSDNLSLIAVNMKLATGGSKEISDGASKLDGGVSAIASKKDIAMLTLTELDKAINKLDGGAKEIFKGSSDMKNGLGVLVKGTGDLNNGSSQMNNGITLLKDGSNTLATKSVELKDGAEKFKTEGIGKIEEKSQDTFNKVDELLKVKDEMFKLSDEYQSFSGIGEDMKGNVKFIIKTDEILKPEIIIEEKKIEAKLTFWDKVSNFFKDLF